MICVKHDLLCMIINDFSKVNIRYVCCEKVRYPFFTEDIPFTALYMLTTFSFEGMPKKAQVSANTHNRGSLSYCFGKDPFTTMMIIIRHFFDYGRQSSRFQCNVFVLSLIVRSKETFWDLPTYEHVLFFFILDFLVIIALFFI